MNLDRSAREYYALEIVTTPAVTSWDATFDGGTTWVAGVTTDGITRWLLAGPDATPAGATVLTATTTQPKIRATSNPEIIVRVAPEIRLR